MSYPVLPIDPIKKIFTRVLISVIPAVALGIGLTSGLEFNEKIVLARYMMFVQAGMFAFLTPWILFPQKPIWFNQMMNPDLIQLMKVLLLRMGNSWLFFIVLMSTILFYNVNPDQVHSLTLFWMDVVLFTTGLCLFAMFHFLRIGRISQLWQEGRRGEKVLAYLKEAGNGPGVPAGSLPTIGTTGIVAITGMFTVIVSSWMLSFLQLPVYTISGLIILMIALISWMSLFKNFHREYYHSTGFYNELFRNPGGKADSGRDPIPYSALYWVPPVIKPQLWLTLRQMDRKLPIGRYLIIGFIFYWSLIYGGILNTDLMFTLPLLFILIKNVIILKMDVQPFSNISYRNQLSTEFGWFWVRFFIGVRWMIPIHLTLLMTIYFVDNIQLSCWNWWMLTDLSSLILINWIAVIRNIISKNRLYA